MAAKLIEISRDAMVLGTLPDHEARELLAAGFLKPDDQYRLAGAEESRRLGELILPAAAASRDASWIAKAKDSIVSAGSAVVGTAGELASQARHLTRLTTSTAIGVPERLLSGFIPQIRRIIDGLAETKPFQSIRNGVRDDDLMQKVFGATYDCLPKPICRFISETQFIAFCMKHRSQLVGGAAVPDAKKPREV